MEQTNRYRIEAADGRILSGASHGPEDGRPVLFIAGAATGQSMTFGDGLREREHVRLFTMDRAGIGDSTPDAARTLASTAADALTFITRASDAAPQEIELIANSQGAVFGLALATLDAFAGLTLVSPADEVAHPQTHALLPAEATALPDLARSNPEEAAQVLRGFTAQEMERMVLSGSHPDDADFYASEPFRTEYRRALAEGFANDGSGYVTDTLIAMRPWEIDLSEIRCRVRVLFGAKDRSHSPDLGETLTSRIPGATRTVFDDAGGALLWTHAAEVLGAASG